MEGIEMLNRYAVLRDEFQGNTVPVWNLDNLWKQALPSGTKVVVLSQPNLSGYVTIRVKSQIFEVWHENVTDGSTNPNRLN